MEDCFPRLYVFPHEVGDSGADLDDQGVGHTIEGLLVVDPGHGEISPPQG